MQKEESYWEHISIRRVSAGDEDFLFQLMNAPAILASLHEVPTQKRDWAEAISAWQEDADEAGYLVLRDNVPIGWFAVNGLLAGDGTAFLKMTVLLPAWQNRGIGRSVLGYILDELRKQGVKEAALYTDQDNIRAQSCYTHCGFRIAETLTERMSDEAVVPRYKMVCSL